VTFDTNAGLRDVDFSHPMRYADAVTAMNMLLGAREKLWRHPAEPDGVLERSTRPLKEMADVPL